MTYCVGCKSADTWVVFAYVLLCNESLMLVVLSTCFSRVMVSLTGPHLCFLFRMCNAYADWDSL